jgi:hypothetical protein
MKEQVDLWAELAPYLVGRETLVEHFSNSVSPANYGSCQEKIGHALKIYENIPRKNRGEQRAPCLAILSHRKPERLLREFGAFEPMDTRGIWVRRPLELGAMFLIVSTQLPQDPQYDWLRMTTRVPNTSQEFRSADALMKESKLDTIKETKLKEVMMETIIDGQTPIDLRNENIELRKGKRAAEEERRAAEEERRAAEEERRAAEERAGAMEAEVVKMRRELEELHRLVSELKG